MEGQDQNEAPDSMWCVVANVVHERPYGSGGEEVRSGTKHFRGGAKVYVIDWYPGMCESVVVVGQHRKSRSFITVAMRAAHLTDFRAKVIYSPTVVAHALRHYATRATLTESEARNMCDALPHWVNEAQR